MKEFLEKYELLKQFSWKILEEFLKRMPWNFWKSLWLRSRQISEFLRASLNKLWKKFHSGRIPDVIFAKKTIPRRFLKQFSKENLEEFIEDFRIFGWENIEKNLKEFLKTSSKGLLLQLIEIFQRSSWWNFQCNFWKNFERNLWRSPLIILGKNFWSNF